MAGYDVSPTAAGFAEYFHRRLDADRCVYATVFYDYFAGRTRPWMGRSLFYRSGTLEDGAPQNVQFAELAGGDFTLRLRRIGWSGTVLYRDMHLRADTPGDPLQKVAEELRRILLEGRAKSLLLIVARTSQDGQGPLILPAAVTRHVAVRSVIDILPYTIFEVTLRDEEAQAARP
jgi:hypothetical protein